MLASAIQIDVNIAAVFLAALLTAITFLVAWIVKMLFTVSGTLSQMTGQLNEIDARLQQHAEYIRALQDAIAGSEKRSRR